MAGVPVGPPIYQPVQTVTAPVPGQVGRLYFQAGTSPGIYQYTDTVNPPVLLADVASAAGQGLSAGVSSGGNTSHTTGLVDAQLVLVGGNNITLSQSINGQSASIIISGPNVAGAQTGISGIIASNATYTSGSVIVSGVGGGVTVASNTGQRVDISVAAPVAQTVQTQNLVDVSLSGNTAGTLTLVSSGTLILAGGNNVTLSQNGQSITISAAAQTVQTQNCVDVSLSGNTAGTLTLISSGTLLLNGGNNITLSQNGQSVTIAGPNTVAQTNQSLGWYALGNTTDNTSGTFDARTLSVHADGSISIGFTNGSLEFSVSQTVQTQNMIDASVLTAGNTAGTLTIVSSGTLFLAGGNNITLSQNGQSITISAGTGAGQSVQTQNCVDLSLAGNTSGTLALISSGTAILSGGTNITLSQHGQTIEIDAATQTVQTQNLHDVSLAGNTSGTLTIVSSGTMILSGGTNITLSQHGQTVEIDAATQTVQTQNCVDLSLSGNTSGTLALVSSGTVILAGGSDITLSQHGQSVTIQGQGPVGRFEPYPFQNAIASQGNPAVNTLNLIPFVIERDLTFNAVNLVASLSLQSGALNQSVTISNGGASSFIYHASQSFTAGQSLIMYLLSKGGGASSTDLQTFASTVNAINSYANLSFALSVTNSSWTIGSSVSVSVSYPAMTSATSTSVNAATTVTLWGPGSSTWTGSTANSSSTSFATSTTAGPSITATYPSTTAWSGAKLIPANWATSLPIGEYWLGYQWVSSTSSSSATATTNMGAGHTATVSFGLGTGFLLAASASYYGATASIASSLGWIGQGSNSTVGPIPGCGIFTATSYAGSVTYYNNAGQQSGEIALSNISTVNNYFSLWMEFASNRI
jgi:hypothetical protein